MRSHTSRSIPFWLLLLTAILPVDAATQEGAAAADPLPIGARVRLQVEGLPEPLVGRFLAVEGDLLRVEIAGRDSVEFASGSIALLERSVGRRGPTLSQGFGLGLLIGAGAGFILGSLDPPDPCEPFEAVCGSDGAAVAVGGALVLGVVGGGVGLAVAAALRREAWEVVLLTFPEVPRKVRD